MELSAWTTWLASHKAAWRAAEDSHPNNAAGTYSCRLDGKRLYVTNSLFSPWDRQFYAEMEKKGGYLLQVRCPLLFPFFACHCA